MLRRRSGPGDDTCYGALPGPANWNGWGEQVQCRGLLTQRIVARSGYVGVRLQLLAMYRTSVVASEVITGAPALPACSKVIVYVPAG